MNRVGYAPACAFQTFLDKETSIYEQLHNSTISTDVSKNEFTKKHAFLVNSTKIKNNCKKIWGSTGWGSYIYHVEIKIIKVMKVTMSFKAQGRKDYMGFQWYKCIVDGVEVRKYHALDADHALRMYNQLNK
jgi:hypothetical protein